LFSLVGSASLADIGLLMLESSIRVAEHYIMIKRVLKLPVIRELSAELLMSASTQMNTGKLISSAQGGKFFLDFADAYDW
jgi:hypothetical protein